MNKKTIIFDLDGTLADINERKQKAQWKSNDKAMDWDIFFDPENIKLDKPKPEVIKCAQMFKEQGYNPHAALGQKRISHEVDRV